MQPAAVITCIIELQYNWKQFSTVFDISFELNLGIIERIMNIRYILASKKSFECFAYAKKQIIGAFIKFMEKQNSEQFQCAHSNFRYTFFII